MERLPTLMIDGAMMLLMYVSAICALASARHGSHT